MICLGFDDFPDFRYHLVHLRFLVAFFTFQKLRESRESIVIVANHGNQLGGVPRNLSRCYAVAPACFLSLNMDVKYADVIYFVVLQV